ncbi:MAG TPA: glycosyltransferase, partial [Candidatus Methylacidiphilales bacterium]
MREEARNVLLRLKAEGEYQVYLPESPLPQEDFYKACAESYLVISPAGAGWDCYRHYEAALCGSVPVMNYPGIRRYRPFLEGEHAFFYDLEDSGLERCIRRALADRPRLVEMGQNARRHVLQYHLYSKLLLMMLKELSKLASNADYEHIRSPNGAP